MAREYLATVLLLILVALVGCTEEETPADRAACLVVEIDALYKEGRFEEAIPRARELLSLTEATGGPKHPAVAESLSGLAELLRQTGDPKEPRQNNLINSGGAGLWPALHNAGGDACTTI